MDTIQTILITISSYALGGATTIFILWLIFIGIPKFKFHKEEKFEQRVKDVIKRNYDRPMNITKEYIKDLIKEVKNEQKK